MELQKDSQEHSTNKILLNVAYLKIIFEKYHLFSTVMKNNVKFIKTKHESDRSVGAMSKDDLWVLWLQQTL